MVIPMDEKIFENMNICFLQGKIVSEVDFEFVYNSKKHTAVVSFMIENNDKNCSKSYGKYENRLYAYDSMADELYAKFEEGDFITIIGRVEKSRVIVLEYFQGE